MSRQPSSEVACVAIASSKDNRPTTKQEIGALVLRIDPLLTASWLTRRSSLPKFPRIWARTPRENDHVWVVDVARIESGGAYPPFGG